MVLPELHTTHYKLQTPPIPEKQYQPLLEPMSGAGQSLSRSYGRYFAEFLNASCPDRLGLLDHPTSVGLRYGLMTPSERRFSWKPKQSDSAPVKGVIDRCFAQTGDLPPALDASHFLRPVNIDALVFRLRHASLRL